MPRARLASATAHIGLCARSHTVRIEIANHNVWMSSEIFRQCDSNDFGARWIAGSPTTLNS
jgi:hypothetical protein